MTLEMVYDPGKSQDAAGHNSKLYRDLRHYNQFRHNQHVVDGMI